MSAVLKSDVSTQRRSLGKSATAARSFNRAASSPSRTPSRAQLTALPSISSDSSVRSLPTTRTFPAWLRLLMLAQRGSSAVTFLLVAVTLVIYGWTVYSQQLWGQTYRQLESLQRRERQTTAVNEVLKDQMARQAESSKSGLVLPDPNRSIFLQPAPNRPAVVPPAAAPVSPPAPAKPLAY